MTLLHRGDAVCEVLKNWWHLPDVLGEKRFSKKKEPNTQRSTRDDYQRLSELRFCIP